MAGNEFCSFVLILASGLGYLLGSCAGTTTKCFECSKAGPEDYNCASGPDLSDYDPRGGRTSPPAKTVDMGRVRVSNCFHPGFCYKTITDEAVELGCLPSALGKCIRNVSGGQDCIDIDNRSQTKIHTCFSAHLMDIDMNDYIKPYPRNRSKTTSSWGKTCICRSDYCNHANPNEITKIKCLSCAGPNCRQVENAVEVNCTQGHCITIASGGSIERSCAPTEYWGICAMEFGDGEGCYGDQDLYKIKECTSTRYGFNPSNMGRRGGWKACVCNDKDLCNFKTFSKGRRALSDYKLSLLLVALLGSLTMNH